MSKGREVQRCAEPRAETRGAPRERRASMAGAGWETAGGSLFSHGQLKQCLFGNVKSA